MTRRTRLVLGGVGGVLLALWAVWWAIALYRLRLPYAEHTWIRHPSLGADFWSQPEHAARVWIAGLNPYENENHLFHYPPLVIRLFLWVPLLPPLTALRVWVLANLALLAVAALAVHRLRPRLGLEPLPFPLLLALLLWSYPVVFQLERANFDLISLAAVLLSLPLFARQTPKADLSAGVLLAVAPWVKLYPGVIGLGLLALRRPRALAGFVVGGVAIGLATPQETRDSFHILGLAIERVTRLVRTLDLSEWTHSLSAAWIRLGIAAPKGALKDALTAIHPSAVAGVLVLGTLLPVCYRVYRSRNTEALTYPLLLWMMAVASSAPIIANDYSLAFLPLAALSVWSRREPGYLQAALLVTIVAYQPFAVPIPIPLLLLLKLLALALVGVALVRRARELDAAPVTAA